MSCPITDCQEAACNLWRTGEWEEHNVWKQGKAGSTGTTQLRPNPYLWVAYTHKPDFLNLAKLRKACRHTSWPEKRGAWLGPESTGTGVCPRLCVPLHLIVWIIVIFDGKLYRICKNYTKMWCKMFYKTCSRYLFKVIVWLLAILQGKGEVLS